jgi:hypothetical protein
MDDIKQNITDDQLLPIKIYYGIVILICQWILQKINLTLII